MIQDIYFRFFNLTHSHKISLLLAYMARFAFFTRFVLKRLLIKKEKLTIDGKKVMGILREASPEPTFKPDYETASHDSYNGACTLSVIVPVYNHIDVLKRCIDSLIHQKTRYSYEVILVDDGSTDGAQIFVDRYRSYDNVRVIHQTNRGIAGARNTGINNARGKYLMFVDCDDYVHEDLVESMISRAERDDCDIVMCAHALVKVKNGVIRSRLPIIYPPNNLGGYKNGDEIMNYAGLPWGKIYKRELFEKVRFFPGYWYEDTIIHGLIFLQCRKFSYIPKVKYEYQWHETNFSHKQGGRGEKKAIDRYWLLKAILKRSEEIGLEKDAKLYTMVLEHVSMYYYPTIAGLPDEIVQAMFLAARRLTLRYKPVYNIKLPYMLRLTEKAILKGDIALWKLCSLNQ